jgi:hypothetical protein
LKFAKAVLYAHVPYGLKPSAQNLMVWYDRLQDLTIEQVEAALESHVAEWPGVLPSPDAIRERVKGDERDPVEALHDEVANLRAVVADLQRRMGVAAEVSQFKPVLRKTQKRKPVAAPVQLALSFEFENACGVACRLKIE